MGKKGKKAKGPQAPGLPLTPREINLDLTLQIETLERELLIKSRIEEELRASTMQLRDKVGQMHADLRQSQKCTFAVTADMARSYKALQEDLINRINSLETTLTEQTEELDMTRHEFQELCRDKDDILAHKERIITELKTRTDTMCSEFHEMLSSTLKLMKDHMAAKLNQDPETVLAQERNMRSVQEQYMSKLQEYGGNVGQK